MVKTSKRYRELHVELKPNHFEVNDGVAKVFVYNGRTNNISERSFLIDLRDWESIKHLRWTIDSKYPFRLNNKKKQYLHRVLVDTKDCVDHINGDGFDNRRFNLRACTRSQNSMNRPHNTKTLFGFKGIEKYNGWFGARIGIGKKKYIRIRGFKTAYEAAIAYNFLAIHHHGEFARLNDARIT